MKKRLILPLVGLTISFALPTYAQQKEMADPQTTQKILAILKAYTEGMDNNDGAAVAALFTRDAVFVTTEGPIIGRQARSSALTAAAFSPPLQTTPRGSGRLTPASP